MKHSLIKILYHSIYYCIMVNMDEAKAFYPNMMSPFRIVHCHSIFNGRGWAWILSIYLRKRMLPNTLDILMWICLCGDSFTDNDLTKELIPCYSHALNLNFLILFYKNSRSFVNLLIRLICQTPLKGCNTALSSKCCLSLKRFLRMLWKYKKYSKFTMSALLLRSLTNPWYVWVESCAAMQSSKDVYPTIVF